MITPLERQDQLAKSIGIPGIYFKREDLHPYGSHKGRSIPIMIDQYFAAGDTHFAISSSGNAALAASMHIAHLNLTRPKTPLTLDIFVGNHISPEKLQRIKKIADSGDGAIRILTKERPLQALIQATNDGARSLRQSTDDKALIGYKSLAQELADFAKTNRISDVFIGTSSGTTAQALAEFFETNKLQIQVHIVQTSSCHPLSDAFDPYDGPDERSSADAIVDITAQRKTRLIPLIKSTGGYGWIATNDDIASAQKLVLEHSGISISTNSALSIVGTMKAAYIGYKISGAAVCMICGQ